jgi:hypothetical protein
MHNLRYCLSTCNYVSYATGHNSFTSQYLLNIYIYYRFCRLCIIKLWICSILNFLKFRWFVLRLLKANRKSSIYVEVNKRIFLNFFLATCSISHFFKCLEMAKTCNNWCFRLLQIYHLLFATCCVPCITGITDSHRQNNCFYTDIKSLIFGLFNFNIGL